VEKGLYAIEGAIEPQQSEILAKFQVALRLRVALGLVVVAEIVGAIGTKQS
jgi:hypothetical protein